MKKEIHLFRGEPGETYRQFSERILETGRELLDREDPESLKISLTIRKPPRFSVIPFRKDLVAALSITRNKPGPLRPVSLTGGYAGGYEVTEAVPVSYEKSWADREPTPGVCLLTLFHRKPGISHNLFLDRWHNGHTPLSLRLHPLWNYNRNVVIRPVTPGTEQYDGIVEEQFKSAGDLLRPVRFFGPWYRVPSHMFLVWKDSRSFIDMKRIEIYLAEEWILRSNAGT